MTKANYEYLLAYKITVPIYDYTVEFCSRCSPYHRHSPNLPNLPDSPYFPYLSSPRTHDQMIQAARSGMTNIPEGAKQESLASYIKLSGVARGSLEELLKDYLSYARQHGIAVWPKEKAIREIGKIREIWEIMRATPTLPDSPNFPALSNQPEIAVNLMLTLIHQANYLIDKLVASLETKHTREGGFSENLLKKRLSFRRHLILFLSPLFLLLPLSPLFVSPAHAANTGPFTAELWVYPTGSAATKAIVAKAEELRVFTDASGYVGCQIKVTTWQTAAQATTTALALNTWSYVACAYDKATLRVFVNGTQTAQTSLTSPPDDTSVVFRLGQDDSASTTYTNLTGTVDDFRFYNYARSAKQVVEDMLAGNPSASSGSPVGYWRFDEGSGAIANNSGNGGSALNGTLTPGAGGTNTTAAAMWDNSGKFSKTIEFDGTDDYISVADSSPISPIAQISLTAWVRPTSTVASQAILVKDGSYRLVTDASGYPICQIHNGTAWQTAATSTKALTLNQWQQVSCSYNQTNMLVYFDGKQTGAATVTTAIADNANAFEVGRDAGATYSYFTGLIDEVKIYNFALTSDEVKTEYNRGSAIVMGKISTDSDGSTPSDASAREYCIPGDTTSCSAPVGEWKMDEKTGTSAYDTSGNGNTGTVTGATWTNGKVGAALNFNGGTDTVTVANSLSTKSVEFWVYPTSTTQNLIDLRTAATAANISVSTGTISATGFTSPTIYVNGIVSSTLVASAWQYVVITTGTAITANAIQFGRISTTSLTGKLDSIRIFDYARTPAQIAWDYNRGGPVGWWKMDECQGGTANDASGNANNGTITIGATGSQTAVGTCNSGVSTQAWNNGATGKFNSSLNFDGTDDVVTVANTVAGVQSVSFWAYPTSTTASMLQLTASANITASSGVITATGFTSPTYYVNGKATTSPTLIASQWNHIVVTTGTGISANLIKLGLVGSTYFSGQIDDARIYNYALMATQVKTLYNENSAVRFGPSSGSP